MPFNDSPPIAPTRPLSTTDYILTAVRHSPLRYTNNPRTSAILTHSRTPHICPR